jgi:hypothetical protein
LKLAPIQRNQYREPDRQLVQERVARAVEADPQAFLDAYAADPRSFGGRYICSDLFKERFPEFSGSPEGRARYNNPVHNSAAVLAAAQFSRILQEPSAPDRDHLLFLTGIPGAGKTSAVMKTKESIPDNLHAIYEGQLAKPGNAIHKIQEALDANLKGTILVVHTPPEVALRNTLMRFQEQGRGASLHVMALIQSELPKGLKAIHDHFGDSVSLTIFDRSGGLNNTKELDGWEHRPSLEREGNYERIHERLSYALNHYRESGLISEDAYRQAQGHATREPSHQNPAEHVGRVERLQVVSTPPHLTPFPVPGMSEWEVRTVDRIAFDLKEGISPNEILRNWSSLAPEKGSEDYFRNLIARALPEEKREAWAFDRRESQDQEQTPIISIQNPERV